MQRVRGQNREWIWHGKGRELSLESDADFHPTDLRSMCAAVYKNQPTSKWHLYNNK